MGTGLRTCPNPEGVPAGPAAGEVHDRRAHPPSGTPSGFGQVRRPVPTNQTRHSMLNGSTSTWNSTPDGGGDRQHLAQHLVQHAAGSPTAAGSGSGSSRSAGTPGASAGPSSRSPATAAAASAGAAPRGTPRPACRRTSPPPPRSRCGRSAGPAAGTAGTGAPCGGPAPARRTSGSRASPPGVMLGCSGVNVWISTRPPRSPRPVRPATWASSWNVRSAARKSGRCRPTSALTTPTSVTFGKSSPFAIICVPSRMWISPSRNASSTRWWLPGRDIVSRVHALHDVVGELRLDLGLQLLGAEPLVADRRLAARRALRYGGLLVAAVVAQQRVAAGGGTSATGRSAGTAATWPHAGQWTCVEKPRRLSSSITWPPALRAFAHRPFERRADGAKRARPAAARAAGRSARPCGSGRFSTRFGSVQQRVLPALGVVPAFERRRRRAEQDRDVLEPGPHDRHVAGVVARRRFLLEAALVLLVDDDQAEVAASGRRRRCGRRRRPAPARPRCAASAPPRSASVRWLCRTATSPQRPRNRSIVCGVRLISGHQDERLLALLDDLLDGPQVDLGLAAAGDAVQQERVESRRPRTASLDRRPDALLVGVERDRARRGSDCARSASVSARARRARRACGPAPCRSAPRSAAGADTRRRGRAAAARPGSPALRSLLERLRLLRRSASAAGRAVRLRAPLRRTRPRGCRPGRGRRPAATACSTWPQPHR